MSSEAISCEVESVFSSRHSMCDPVKGKRRVRAVIQRSDEARRGGRICQRSSYNTCRESTFTSRARSVGQLSASSSLLTLATLLLLCHGCIPHLQVVLIATVSSIGICGSGDRRRRSRLR